MNNVMKETTVLCIQFLFCATSCFVLQLLDTEFANLILLSLGELRWYDAITWRYGSHVLLGIMFAFCYGLEVPRIHRCFHTDFESNILLLAY